MQQFTILFKVGEMPKENSTEAPVMRIELADTTRNKGTIAKEDSESSRARKRQHNQTQGDIAMTPSVNTVPPQPPPNLTHELTMPHQMDSFKP